MANDRKPDLIPELDAMTCVGMEDATQAALVDAALHGSGFVMLVNTDEGLRAEYLPFNAVQIDVQALKDAESN
jgi:hypothetical protein